MFSKTCFSRYDVKLSLNSCFGYQREITVHVFLKQLIIEMPAPYLSWFRVNDGLQLF